MALPGFGRKNSPNGNSKQQKPKPAKPPKGRWPKQPKGGK